MEFNKEVSVTIDGMQGFILLTSESVEMNGTVHSPVMGLHPIDENRVLTVYYRNPSYDDDFIFPARQLEGAKMPLRVLKAHDNNDPNYKPQIGEFVTFFVKFSDANLLKFFVGFGQRTQQGYLDQSGHRMMNHYSNNYNSGNGNQQRQDRGGAYSSVAPPSYQSRKYRFFI